MSALDSAKKSILSLKAMKNIVQFLIQSFNALLFLIPLHMEQYHPAKTIDNTTEICGRTDHFFEIIRLINYIQLDFLDYSEGDEIMNFGVIWIHSTPFNELNRNERGEMVRFKS